MLWLQGGVERALHLQRVPGEGGRASLRGPRLRPVQLRHAGRRHGLLHECSQQGGTAILSLLTLLCSLIKNLTAPDFGSRGQVVLSNVQCTQFELTEYSPILLY